MNGFLMNLGLKEDRDSEKWDRRRREWAVLVAISEEISCSKVSNWVRAARCWRDMLAITTKENRLVCLENWGFSRCNGE